jgi:rSAM/selenodomain-associated transferase 1
VGHLTENSANISCSCVLFFLKYPEKGRVKSRLSAEFDETLTIKLYKKFVHDLLTMLDKTSSTIVICYYPKDALDKFTMWLGSHHYYLPQKGDDLGQRMKNSFIDAFANKFEPAIIIGSDSPDLPLDYINEAFSSLKTHDVVIGPCHDGGYYLIGFTQNSFLPKAFDGIHWSTESVFAETMNIMINEGLKIHTLPKWSDVDTLSDLKALFKRNQKTDFSSSETISFLSNLNNLE